ncbi:chemotaxis protein CheA [Antarcticimicrobium sediminis]|uniref:Chemotaxis protein CheA n=1 Tax=Antarcticimicrobium sediminis TaxID=2546227 RepID=A0A4R5F0K8_9RHOB|nr:chemotaxis protein CheA [Antarcticimicrobium sediminis]TDE40879.1 chemotaxis protein CheA [Antarcticimicrobium sediminis]
MVQSNKVLTVSYGTFSCTLEGFEDSFDTMTAIAEYFRDLASDDRYFGAEPPQPDTEMLARIAEREVSRHVEARREGSGYVLRTAQAGIPAALTGAASAPAPTDTPADAAVAAPVDTPVSAPAPQAKEAQPVAEDTLSTTTETEAQTAAQTEACAEPAPVQDATQVVEQETPEVDAPEIETPAETVDVPAAPTATQTDEEEAAEIDEIESDIQVEAEHVEDENDTVEPDVLDAELVTPEVATDPDSIAAKLRRIRAVVSRNDASSVELDYSEDEHFEDSLAAAPTEEAVEQADSFEDDSYEEDAFEDDDEAELEDEDDAFETDAEDDFDDDAVEDEIQHEEKPAEAVAQDQDADSIDEIDPRRAARLRRRMARAQKAAEAEAAASAEAELQARAARDVEFAPNADDTALFADLESLPEDKDLSAPGHNMLSGISGRGANRRRHPHVMTVKRDAYDAAADKIAEDAEVAAPVATTRPIVPSVDLPPSTLPEEDEDELMRELAEVEAELRGNSYTAQTATPVEQTAQDDDDQDDDDDDIDYTAQPAQAPAEDDGSDLSRLMAAVGEKLDAPEAANTRETYSHLRAAVAATQAERSAGGSVDTNPDAAAYREDLARVVQPRRPRPGASRRPRPEAAEQGKPAPLKLVAEQRVDKLAATTGPVRPRRVATPVQEPIATGIDDGFAAFADEMGVQDLPELLEAAAAYMQFVEGRDQFTRPQLIHKAREVAEDEFSREDGLRSFGMLLRQGKIVKTENGRFVASHEIGFQPASRAAG